MSEAPDFDWFKFRREVDAFADRKCQMGEASCQDASEVNDYYHCEYHETARFVRGLLRSLGAPQSGGRDDLGGLSA